MILIRVAALLAFSVVHAQQPQSDAVWTKAFAAPPTAKIPGDEIGQQNRLNGDPRFTRLLRSAFRQHQFFWFDHHHFTPLADVIQIFLGVPGDALLEEDPFVTLDGCVPHDCFDRGMLWMDTAHPASLIFVATGMVQDGPKDPGSGTHLWLFASTPMNWQKFPPAFLHSLERWNRDSNGEMYAFRFMLVTLVQPSGEQIDLSPSLFQLSPPASGVKP